MSLHFSIAPNINESTTLNILELPTSDDKVIKKAVRFELEQQDIVSSLGDEYYLWEVLDKNKEQSDLEVDLSESELLVATIRKNILYELAQMRKIAWKIERIDLQHEIVSRFIKGNATVIDFGHEHTRLYFFKNDKLKGVETLDIGGKYFSEAIQKELDSQSLGTAEEIKHKSKINFGFLNRRLMSESLRVASDASTEVAGNLTDDIKRAIRSFELGNQISHQNIYYTGGGAAHKNFIPFLADELGEEVEPLHKSMTDEGSVVEDEWTEQEDEEDDEFSDFLIKDEFSEFLDVADDESEEDEGFLGEPDDSFTEIIENQEEINQESRLERKQNSRLFDGIVPEESEYYDLAVITAFGEDEVNVLNFNFVRFLKFQFDLNSIFIALLVMSVTLFFGVRAVHHQYDSDINRLNSEVGAQSSTISSLQSESGMLTQEKSSYEGLISLVQDLKSQNKWYSSILYTIPEQTPSGIAIQHIRIQGDVLIIDGYATDYSNVGFFAMELEELGDVKIAEINDLESSDIIVSDVVDTDQLSKEDAVTKTFKIEIRQQSEHMHDEEYYSGEEEAYFNDEYYAEDEMDFGDEFGYEEEYEPNLLDEEHELEPGMDFEE